MNNKFTLEEIIKKTEENSIKIEEYNQIKELFEEINLESNYNKLELLKIYNIQKRIQTIGKTKFKINNTDSTFNYKIENQLGKIAIKIFEKYQDLNWSLKSLSHYKNSYFQSNGENDIHSMNMAEKIAKIYNKRGSILKSEYVIKDNKDLNKLDLSLKEFEKSSKFFMLASKTAKEELSKLIFKREEKTSNFKKLRFNSIWLLNESANIDCLIYNLKSTKSKKVTIEKFQKLKEATNKYREVVESRLMEYDLSFANNVKMSYSNSLYKISLMTKPLHLTTKFSLESVNEAIKYYNEVFNTTTEEESKIRLYENLGNCYKQKYKVDGHKSSDKKLALKYYNMFLENYNSKNISIMNNLKKEEVIEHKKYIESRI